MSLKITNEDLIHLWRTDRRCFWEESFNTVAPGFEYKDNWHIHCILEHLEAVERSEIRRLIINMPPRALKSITVNIAWPAWLLAQTPEEQIISCSYSHSLASDQSIDTRLIIESDWYKIAFPRTRLAKDQNEKTKFRTTLKGHRIASSVGGTLTGMGGNYLILDDPLKPDEAPSDTIRMKTNNWITQTFLTRENDAKTSRAVLVMQRLHENDPAGMLLEKGWHPLILPAYFEEKTVIEVNNKSWINEEGDYLHEERMGEDELDLKLQELGLYGFVGQYMQKPSPESGGVFSAHNILYYDNYSRKFTVDGMNIFILYDPANEKKDKERNDPDYTAIVVVGLANDNNYYILDIVRDRMNPTERIEALIQKHMKWNARNGKGKTIKVAVEKYGMMTDSHYLRVMQEEYNYRFPVIEVGGPMSKQDRIRKLEPLFSNQRVYLPKKILYDSIDGNTYELVESFKDELCMFPYGKHDDMIDAFARILDDKLNARFPKIEVVYLEAGQSRRDLYEAQTEPQDWMDF